MPTINNIAWYVYCELLHCMCVLPSDLHELQDYYLQDMGTDQREIIDIHDPQWIAIYILMPAESITRIMYAEYCKRLDQKPNWKQDRHQGEKSRFHYDVKRKYIAFFMKLIKKNDMWLGKQGTFQDEIENLVSTKDDQKEDPFLLKYKPKGLLEILLMNFPAFIQEYLKQQWKIWKKYREAIVERKSIKRNKKGVKTAGVALDENDRSYLEKDVFTVIETVTKKKKQQQEIFAVLHISQTFGQVEKKIEIDDVIPKIFQNIAFLRLLVVSGSFYPNVIKEYNEGNTEYTPPTEGALTVEIRPSHYKLALETLTPESGEWIRPSRNSLDFQKKWEELKEQYGNRDESNEESEEEIIETKQKKPKASPRKKKSKTPTGADFIADQAQESKTADNQDESKAEESTMTDDIANVIMPTIPRKATTTSTVTTTVASPNTTNVVPQPVATNPQAVIPVNDPAQPQDKGDEAQTSTTSAPQPAAVPATGTSPRFQVEKGLIDTFDFIRKEIYNIQYERTRIAGTFQGSAVSFTDYIDKNPTKFRTYRRLQEHIDNVTDMDKSEAVRMGLKNIQKSMNNILNKIDATGEKELQQLCPNVPLQPLSEDYQFEYKFIEKMLEILTEDKCIGVFDQGQQEKFVEYFNDLVTKNRELQYAKALIIGANHGKGQELMQKFHDESWFPEDVKEKVESVDDPSELMLLGLNKIDEIQQSLKGLITKTSTMVGKICSDSKSEIELRPSHEEYTAMATELKKWHDEFFDTEDQEPDNRKPPAKRKSNDQNNDSPAKRTRSQDETQDEQDETKDSDENQDESDDDDIPISQMTTRRRSPRKSPNKKK